MEHQNCKRKNTDPYEITDGYDGSRSTSTFRSRNHDSRNQYDTGNGNDVLEEQAIASLLAAGNETSFSSSHRTNHDSNIDDRNRRTYATNETRRQERHTTTNRSSYSAGAKRLDDSRYNYYSNNANTENTGTSSTDRIDSNKSSSKSNRWGKRRDDNDHVDESNSKIQRNESKPNLGEEVEAPVQEKKEPISKPSFALSGALATDNVRGNVYHGIVLKFVEPPEARAPNTRWRLYVFRKKRQENAENPELQNDTKGAEDASLIQVLHISKQSAYLFGREHKIADIPVDHPSLSKQHCVLQYRALPDKNDRELKVRCRPYLMDLGSTNGTFLNGVRLDEARYYELRRGDVITLGTSSREYVLMTENTTQL